MPIFKFDAKDVKYKHWSEILGVKHQPGSVCYLFTAEQSKKIGATIEKWPVLKPAQPVKWVNDYDEAWYMIAGQLYVESEGVTYLYKPGDFGIATKGSYTLWVPEDSPEDMVAFVVHCPPTDTMRENFVQHAKNLSEEEKK